MWRFFRVHGIHAPLFWSLAFFSFGVCASREQCLLLISGPLIALSWICIPRFRVDLMLTAGCILLGWGRMEWQLTHAPICEKEFVDQWTCQCPFELSAPCNCTSLNTHQSWVVEMGKRQKHGTTKAFWGRISPFIAQGEFNLKRWKYTQNIQGRITPLEPISVSTGLISKPNLLSTWRESFRNGLKSNFDPDAEALLLAVFLGDKTGLSKEVKRAFSNGGIAHVLAVSGYHIGLVGLAPFLLIRNRRRWLRIIGFMLFPAIWMYVLLCHAPVSAVRAAVMSTAYVVGPCFRRPISPFQCWSLAGIIVLLWKPHAVMALGTQLSFVAVAAILVVLMNLKQAGWSQNWRLSFAIPIAAQFGTIAWTAHAFGRFPLAFLPMNMLIAPWMSSIGLGTLLWLGLHQIDVLSPLSHGLGQLISWVVENTFHLLQYADAHLSWAPSIHAWSPILWCGLTALFFAWNIVLLVFPNQRLAWSLRIITLVMLFIPWLSPWPSPFLEISTSRSKAPVLVLEGRSGIRIVAENNWDLDRVSQKLRLAKGISSDDNLLALDQFMIWETGWVYRNSTGDWKGQIQSRPFSWNRTGENNQVKTIQWGKHKFHWLPWCPNMDISSNEADWSKLGLHTLATPANPQ